MKSKSCMTSVLGAVLVAFSVPALAADGAQLYKTKCSHCHGAQGQGKKAPALKGTDKSADDIAALLTQGDPQKKAPHSKALAGMNADSAKAIADYIKTLK